MLLENKIVIDKFEFLGNQSNLDVYRVNIDDSFKNLLRTLNYQEQINLIKKLLIKNKINIKNKYKK